MIKLEIPAVPSAEDKFFLSAEDWWNNACLNFLQNGWNLYAIGYKEAADIPANSEWISLPGQVVITGTHPRTIERGRGFIRRFWYVRSNDC